MKNFSEKESAFCKLKLFKDGHLLLKHPVHDHSFCESQM